MSIFPPNFIVSDRIRCQSEAGSKKVLLEQLSQLFADSLPHLSEDLVFDHLLERERLGSTGVGQCVALPHARIEEVTEACGAFVHLQTGIDFDAVDNQPVDLVFAMLVPHAANEEHLQLLAHLAAIFSDAEICQKLRQLETADAVLDVLSQWQP